MEPSPSSSVEPSSSSPSSEEFSEPSPSSSEEQSSSSSIEPSSSSSSQESSVPSSTTRCEEPTPGQCEICEDEYVYHCGKLKIFLKVLKIRLKNLQLLNGLITIWTTNLQLKDFTLENILAKIFMLVKEQIKVLLGLVAFKLRNLKVVVDPKLTLKFALLILASCGI